MSATRSKPKGRFITFEGIDGCGKSTQMQLALKYLEEIGHTVTAIREPGSTPAAERIRDLLLDRNVHMSDITELLLYEAARADVVRKQIIPLLKKGNIVLCDRFFDSTTAYQGYGRKLDIGMIKQLNAVAVGKLRPDLTLLFDVSIEAGLVRCSNTPDRLESQPIAFFKRVRKGFLQIAKEENKRIKIIDSLRTIEEIFVEVAHELNQLLSRK